MVSSFCPNGLTLCKAMEGSSFTPLRLRGYMERTGTTAAWLGRQLGVSRAAVSNWVLGMEPMPEGRQEQILAALRERADLPISEELFETEGDDVGVEREAAAAPGRR